MEVNGQKKYFTTIGRGHGAPCFPASREDWERLRREPWLKEMCERIEKGEEELKHKLPVWTPSCAEFKDNHRAIADALKPLPRLMMDFDEKGHTDEIVKSLTIDHSPLTVDHSPLTIDHSPLTVDHSPLTIDHSPLTIDHSPLTVLLIEESVRRGTHVLVELPEGMTADEAQRLMAEATGYEPDKAVKDVARCIYMVPEDHTKFISDRLWITPLQLPRGGEIEASPRGGLEGVASPLPHREGLGESLFKGIPYSSIIREYWYRTGGEPQEGERNVKLHKLAVNLRAICDNRKEVLMQVMPRFGLSETEMKSIVDSACKEPPKGISKMMQQILTPLLSPEGDMPDDAPQDYSSPLGDLKRGLPIGLKESLIGVPQGMQMPVLCSVLPIAAAYADQVEVEYCDGMRQRLGLMSIIRGEQASGKSVCKNAVDIWKRQFDEEDALARKREEEWKERKKARKANEKAPDDPKVLIRMVPVTVSCSTLLKRFKYANGHCLYSFGEELDTLRKTNGAGSWSSKYDIYRLSFDNGEWGQDYNSDQAESGMVKVAYNWTMLGTNGAMRKCFKQDNIENGLSSRVLVAEMPDSSFSKMPKFGKRSAEDEARINEAVTKLRSYSGFIDTPRLRKAIERWVEEKRVEAAKDIDRVKDTYRKRAAVIGFRCGVICRLLEGKESNRCLEFATAMAEYCLQQQISAFGEALSKEYVEAKDECQRYGANHSVFDHLAPVFTMDDLRAMKRGFCGESALRNIITRWRRDGWIEKTDSRHWKKVAKA
ncbi:MAG: DUF3987 domain-containing protein [Prevotella sp.]|nr:DUF3987 domain-containing protein [Prevotella sp.]